MNLEAKVKADRERKDFVWVRPANGSGSVSITAGGFSVKCTQDQPAEITRAEWENIFKREGLLEEVPAPQSAAQVKAKTQEE